MAIMGRPKIHKREDYKAEIILECDCDFCKERGSTKLYKHECKRCGHKWIFYKNNRICPNTKCNSPLWMFDRIPKD